MNNTSKLTRKEKQMQEEAKRKGKVRLWIALITVVILLILKLIPPPGGPGCEVWMGFDASGSNGLSEKEKFCRLSFHIIDAGLPDRSLLHISIFGNECDPVWTVRPSNAGEVYPLIEVLEKWKCRGPGTRPDKFVNSTISEMQAAARKDRSTVIILFTDGEISNAREMRLAIDDLVKLGNPSAVWVAGIPTEDRSRKRVEELFSPLGDRLIITGDDLDSEIGFGMEKLNSLLSQKNSAKSDITTKQTSN